MTQTTKRFTVDEFIPDEIPPLVWVKLMEGEKKGLYFALPTEHDAYTDDVSEKLDALEPGDTFTATVKSENERNTKWRFVSITMEP